MGRKKRGVNVLKPFCYYCEKEFENVNILLQHQKNRHFACKLCTRKFSTASSLQTHMNQVHGQSIQKVSNAIAGRDRVDINIYGMDEVPVDIIEDRIAKKINKKKAKLRYLKQNAEAHKGQREKKKKMSQRERKRSRC